MNTENTTPTAAELLAEWERYNESRVMAYTMRKDADVIRFQNECDTRAAQLDRLCEDAGISINDDGVFAYASDKMVWALGYGGGYRFLNISARDQQALQEWLLIKENGK